MLKRLKPDLYMESIFEIDFQALRNSGIENLICDIDNTIIAWDKDKITTKLVSWFADIKKQGFNICFVSNNTKKRVEYFTEKLAIPSVHRAIKPRKKAFIKALSIMNAKSYNTAVIGDQLFTDVLGGKRMGLFTVLVVPIGEKEFFMTKIVRKIERSVLRHIKCNVKGG